MSDQQFFCPNCGTKISKADTFCPNCGFNVKQYLTNLKANHQDEMVPKLNSQSRVTSDSRQQLQQSATRTPRKPMRKWQLGIVIIVILALAGGYLFLNNYYSKTATANRLVTAIKQDQGKTAAKLIKTSDPSFKVTATSVQPLINYYSRHKDKLAKFKSAIDGTGYVNDHLQFVNQGHRFLIFNHYVLKAKTIYPDIQTNRANAQLKVNGDVVAKKIKTTDGKKIGPYLPGQYQIQTTATVNGRKLKNTGDYGWIDPSASDESVSLSLQTISYTVKGQAGAKLYLNNKELGKIPANGFYAIKDYPFSENMTVALSMKTASGKVVRSDNTPIDMSMNSATVSPKFPGFATVDDANTLINDIWGDISDGTVTDEDSADDDNFGSYFVGGSTSSVYVDLLKMIDSYMKNDHILDYSMSTTVKSVVPYDTDQTLVTYNVKYHFELDDHDHVQIFQYNAIIQPSGDTYKMKTNDLDHKVDDYETDD